MAAETNQANMTINNPSIYIVGPTGAGKSDLALTLAQKHHGVIINFDSVQFYKGLQIGSAAPTETEKKTVPHYLYSYVPAPKEMTAGEFLRDLKELLPEIKNNQPLFFVGGTGFYQQALEKGMYDVPEIALEIKQTILDEFKNGGHEHLWAELNSFDPQHGLHSNDHYRIGRALELKRAFNLKASDIKQNQQKKIVDVTRFLKVGVDLDKDILKKRIEARAQKMLASGLIEETEFFLKQGFSEWAPLNSVGYKETKDYLQGRLSKENLAAEIAASTNKLIKKQRTWFKRDEAVLWSKGSDLQSEVAKFLL